MTPFHATSRSESTSCRCKVVIVDGSCRNLRRVPRIEVNNVMIMLTAPVAVSMTPRS